MIYLPHVLVLQSTRQTERVGMVTWFVDGCASILQAILTRYGMTRNQIDLLVVMHFNSSLISCQHCCGQLQDGRLITNMCSMHDF